MNQTTMRRKLIAGNWKSHKTVAEAQAWIQAFSQNLQNPSRAFPNISVVIAAPFTALAVAVSVILDWPKVSVRVLAKDVSVGACARVPSTVPVEDHPLL